MVRFRPNQRDPATTAAREAKNCLETLSRLERH
jgi:hypothetical protein